ncbi:MAG: arylsulfatase [Sphingobacteriaceae bacterium]|nr:arylsulfatase [Sphingobacteriaceae bacterium]
MKKAFLALIILTSFCIQASAQKKKPNIILIMADDLGMETLGCYGNDDHLTPNLDKLAASGMLFENCYATPLCTPSRVQLMTGKYNNRNYVGFGILDSKEKTFADVLKQQGYKTCIAGKWQLYGYEKQWQLAGGRKGSYPQDSGFDKFCVWQVDQVGSRYKDPVVYSDNLRSTELKGKFGDDVFVNYIGNFISENREGPFFAYYPMCLTHDPFIPTPASADYESSAPKTDDPKYFKDMLSYMDQTVGKLLAKVDELGLREETVIMFIGDNGTSPLITSRFRGGTYQGDKGQTTERGTHVPLLVSWKGVVKPGSKNTSLVDFTDFLPTFRDIAGMQPAPKTEIQDGLSFYPQLKGNLSTKRDWVFCHYDPKWGTFKEKTYVHNKEWKLYTTGEIFNVRTDRDELKPLTKAELPASGLKTIKEFEKVLKIK